MKKILLSFTIILCIALTHSYGQMYILNEDFSSASGTTPPNAWTNIVNVGGVQDMWHFDNPGNQQIGFPIIAPFAIFDAGSYSNNNQQEQVSLETPAFDASISNFIILEFDHVFSHGAGSSCKIQAFNGQIWQDVITYNNSIPNATHAMVDISGYCGGITNAKLRFTWSGNGSGFWAIDNLSIYGALPIDAGILSIDSPQSPFSPGDNPVKITLKNYGYNSLTNTKIRWKVGQDEQQQFNWTGNLTFGQSLTNIQIGTFNFQNPVIIKVWSENPNGQNDPNPHNDTITTELIPLIPSLCGTYTIGGNNPDFATFTQAVNDLQFAGISCPVKFLIRNGDYPEKFIIGNVPGSSAQNTISFESESGDSSAVTIRYEGWPNIAVNLKQTQYINFKGIGFRGHNGLKIEDFAHHINIENCLFTSNDRNMEIKNGSHDIDITHCTFEGAFYGILLAQDEMPTHSIQIHKNSFLNPDFSAISLMEARQVSIEENNIQSNRWGITLTYSKYIVVNSNRISTTSRPDGITANIYTLWSDTLQIFNNYIQTAGIYASFGIYLSNTANTGIFFNSINLTTTDIAKQSKGLFIDQGGNNVVKNNIFNIKEEGFPIDILEGTLGYTLDFNNYYHPDDLIGRNGTQSYYSLMEWRAATSQDSNSQSENPFYTSDSDLSINQILLDNVATPVAGIIKDIDGTTRASQPDMGAKEYNPCQNDAGINRITSPSNPLEPGQNSVIVLLQNQGNAPLSSVVINWKINDDFQPPFTWSGSIPAKENQLVTIGNYNFGNDTYVVSAWTTQPNGSADCNTFNDRSSRKLLSSLCGIYTIGGANPDFTTFTQAVDNLNIAGISCPVKFIVRDGDYPEQFIIRNVPGSSALNTISFESESADSSAVTIRFEGYPNTAVNLKQAQYINFKGIGFRGFYGLIIEDFTHHIDIENCLFTSNDKNIEIRNGSYDIDITHCTFKGASTGIVFASEGKSTHSVQINKNLFQNQYNSSISLYNARQVTIDGNLIQSNRNGITLDYGKHLIIKNNRINLTSNLNGIVASNIYIKDCDTLQIFNNYIQTEGIYPCNGIYLYNTANTGIYFNSVNLTTTDNAKQSSGLLINQGGNNVVKNNIFNSNGKGFPIDILEGTSGYTLDFNDYYHPDDLIGRNGTQSYYSLVEWRAATSQDSNSQSENPFYTSDSDLSINQILLDNVATPVAGIDKDIDGTTRTSQPDLGAKEYNPCQNDAGINRITSPSNHLEPGQNSVIVLLQNQGNAPLTSVVINWKINDEVQPPFTWTGSIPAQENQLVTIGDYNFENASYVVSSWTTQPNGSADCNTFNDRSSRKLFTLLCGIYTIGGINPDFVTFTQAVDNLNLVGISCPVKFLIRDGDYPIQFIIGNVPGSSAQNTITFESESGDSSAVTIRFEGYPNTAVNLKQAQYINFKGIGFGGYYGLIIEDFSNHIKIENCLFASDDWNIGIRNGSHDIDITHCTFEGANTGIFLVSRDISPHSVQINQNFFLNQHNSAIKLYDARQVNIDGNQIQCIRNGIILSYSEHLTVKNNRISMTSQPDWTKANLYIEGCDTLQIFNNYLQTEGIYPCDGIYLSKTDNSGIYFNTVNLTTNDIAKQSKGLLISQGNNNVLKNNIFNIKEQGTPIEIYDGTLGYTLDFNDYYHPDGLIGRKGTQSFYSLNDWAQTINGDVNSNNVNPYFASPENPLPYQRELNGSGIPIAGILLDINNRIRNNQAPDIGCIEFTVDFGVTDLISPNLNCIHSTSDSVTVYLRQFGDLPFINLNLAYQINNGVIHYDMIPGTIYNDLEFTFSTAANISVEGEYHFKVWVINALDDNLNNDTLRVVIYTKPAPSVDFSYTNECTGREVHFNGTASVAEPYSIESYEWLFGGGEISMMQNPVHEFPTAGSFPITLRAYSNAGCYNYVEKVIFIDNYEKLQLDFITTDETCNELCNGKTEINLIGGEAPMKLYLNESLILQYALDGLCSGNYNVKVADNQGCETIGVFSIQAGNSFPYGIAADVIQGTAPLTVNLSALQSAGVTYQWYYNGEQFDTSPTTSITLTDEGVQNIILKTTGGAIPSCTYMDTVQITVEFIVNIFIPNAFTPNNDGFNDTFGPVTEGIESLKMNINDRNGRLIHTIDAVHGRWDGNMPSGDPVAEGVYFYSLLSRGFDQKSYPRQGSVSLYRDLIDMTPNPVKTRASIDFTNQMTGSKLLSIYNSSGNKIKEWTILEDIVELDLSFLGSGLYILVVNNAQRTVSIKFIKD